MEVIVLGLWALAAVSVAWVVVLSRMLTARRESDQREMGDPWVWPMPDWGDTVPVR